MENQFPNIPSGAPENDIFKKDEAVSSENAAVPVGTAVSPENAAAPVGAGVSPENVAAPVGAAVSPENAADLAGAAVSSENMTAPVGAAPFAEEAASGECLGSERKAEAEPRIYTDPNSGYGQNAAPYTASNAAPHFEYKANWGGGANPAYQMPYPNPSEGMDTAPMSMTDWLLTLLACMIPCANIVLLFVWAFGKKGNINRRNFCRAQLILIGAIIALYALVMVLIVGLTIAGGAGIGTRTY